ncbi:gliding motility-associated C-terminal domain-containing protein, partial [Spirosoma fluminis]
MPVQGPASFTFVDTGEDRVLVDGNTSGVLSADSSYCYRVLTRGRYSDARLAGLGVLINYSQILCASPTDTTRPCPPTLGLDSLNCASLSSESFCEQSSFTNQLRWQGNSGAGCDATVVGYKLYYGRYQQDSPAVLTQVPAPTTSFAHTNLTSVAGCYYVTAVNSRGLESAPSNRVCNEACPELVLPNVFTPNGDGKNDVFAPLRCARFVEQVGLVVYNRWGAKVYEGSSASLSWDGRSSDGAELPSGLYYYQVSVRYGVLDRTAPPQVLKGWVQLLRENVSLK